MSRVRIVCLAKYVLACSASILWLAAWGFSQSITVAPRSASPTLTTLVSGTGFSAGAEVDIYFDTADLALAVTDDTGSFASIALKVPATAVPGKHWVSGVDRSTGSSAQTPFWVNTNWAQFHKRAIHDGHNFTENVLSPDNVGSLGLLWRYITGTGRQVHSSPAVANGMVYIGSDDNNVYALNASTGRLRWKYTTICCGVYSSPAVANGVAYVGSGDYNVYALNAGTGALRWKFTAGNRVYSSPAVANGVVYIGSYNGTYALNARTGALLWQYSIAAESSPAVASGVVYVSSEDGCVYALNAGTGTLFWRNCTGIRLASSPAVANGVVYVSLLTGNVYALSASTGSRLWQYSTVAPNYMYSSPAVADGVVYIGSGDGVYALKARTGALLWKYTTGNSVNSSPAVANGVVYVGSADHNVYALNAGTGALLWKYTTGAEVYSSPAVANGVVYVGSEDHRVYAFGPSRSALPAVSQRPNPQALSPDLSLPVSAPTTKLPASEE